MAKISGLESRPCCTANQPNSVKPDGEFISLKLSSQNYLDSIIGAFECAVMPNYAISWSYIPGLMCLSLMIWFSQVWVAGPQHQENRMVTWGRGETSPPGQADAHSVEDNRPHHRTNSCSVSGALRVSAVRTVWCTVSLLSPVNCFCFLHWIQNKVIATL